MVWFIFNNKDMGVSLGDKTRRESPGYYIIIFQESSCSVFLENRSNVLRAQRKLCTYFLWLRHKLKASLVVFPQRIPRACLDVIYSLNPLKNCIDMTENILIRLKVLSGACGRVSDSKEDGNERSEKPVQFICQF